MVFIRFRLFGFVELVSDLNGIFTTAQIFVKTNSYLATFWLFVNVKLPEVWYYDAKLQDSGKWLINLLSKHWNWIQILHNNTVYTRQVIVKIFYSAVSKIPM